MLTIIFIDLVSHFSQDHHPINGQYILPTNCHVADVQDFGWSQRYPIHKPIPSICNVTTMTYRSKSLKLTPYSFRKRPHGGHRRFTTIPKYSFPNILYGGFHTIGSWTWRFQVEHLLPVQFRSDEWNTKNVPSWKRKDKNYCGKFGPRCTYFLVNSR